MKKNRSAVGGFTLVEMMVVIAIIGILATVIIVNIAGKTDKARAGATEAIIKQIAMQVELFKADHMKYPENLMDLYRMPSYIDARKWPPGGYVTDPPQDAWGQDLIYRLPGSEGAPFDIVSFGADGREGGEGFDADIWNRRRIR